MGVIQGAENDLASPAGFDTNLRSEVEIEIPAA